MPDELYTVNELDAAVNEALREAEAKHKAEMEQAEARAREKLAGELAAAVSDKPAGSTTPAADPPVIDHAELTSKVITRTNMVERTVLEAAKRFQAQYRAPMPPDYIESLRTQLSSPEVTDEALGMILQPNDDAQKGRADETFDSIIGTAHARAMREGKLKLPSGADPNLPFSPNLGGSAGDEDNLAAAKKLAAEMGRDPNNLTMDDLRMYAQLGKDAGLI